MPQRFLRPDIRTSQRWNETSFGAQSLYVGLLTLVDDFGRYDGRSKLIHGEVFILRDDVKPQQTAAWLKELDRRDLVQLYEVEGKFYLQISRWKERTRSESSKFPAPPLRNPAEYCGILPPKSSPLAISHKPLADAGFDEFWELYPNKQKKPRALAAWCKATLNTKASDITDGLRLWSGSDDWRVEGGRFVPHPATFLNERRWEDRPNGATLDPGEEAARLRVLEFHKKRGVNV